MEEHHVVVGRQLAEGDGEHHRLADRHLVPVQVQPVVDGGGVDRPGHEGSGVVRDVVRLVGMGAVSGGDQDGVGRLCRITLRVHRDVRPVGGLRLRVGRDLYRHYEVSAGVSRQRPDRRRSGARPYAADGDAEGVGGVARVGHAQRVGDRFSREAHVGGGGGREQQSVDRPGPRDQHAAGRPGGVALRGYRYFHRVLGVLARA